MKILNEGDWQWTGQVRCPRCAADLEVEGDDLRITYGDEDYQGPEWYNADVKCPRCATVFKVDAPNQTLRAIYWAGKHPRP